MYSIKKGMPMEGKTNSNLAMIRKNLTNTGIGRLSAYLHSDGSVRISSWKRVEVDDFKKAISIILDRCGNETSPIYRTQKVNWGGRKRIAIIMF